MRCGGLLFSMQKNFRHSMENFPEILMHNLHIIHSCRRIIMRSTLLSCNGVPQLISLTCSDRLRNFNYYNLFFLQQSICKAICIIEAWNDVQTCVSVCICIAVINKYKRCDASAMYARVLFYCEKQIDGNSFDTALTSEWTGEQAMRLTQFSLKYTITQHKYCVVLSTDFMHAVWK